MLSKNKKLSNFSNAIRTRSPCFRPDNERQIAPLFSFDNPNGILARGNGASYGDCCLNNQGIIIDTSRLNHLLSFDENSGLLICQGSVSFADLFTVSPQYIPPVIPGTLKATVAGGIANDIHGKNNHRFGCFGRHIEWLDLQSGAKTLHCSRQENTDLFYATIGGLGLTGIINRVAINMRKASHFVTVNYEKYDEFASLIKTMQTKGCEYDYQVAWLDLLNKPHALLSLANHCEGTMIKPQPTATIPKLPVRFIYPWAMKFFNRFYFKAHQTTPKTMPLTQFNNPLDSITHWNRLYGKHGLLQFQAVVSSELAFTALNELLAIIRTHRATPTLAVLKYFTESGPGLLSFVKPGFTIAIDFINNRQAQQAISLMNEWITKAKGKVYLAKDLLLTENQFTQQYPQHGTFSTLLKQHLSPMRSDLSRRLRII